MKLNPTTYIPQLYSRIQNLYNRKCHHHGIQARRAAYLQMVAFTDTLNLIRDDISNGRDANKSMLALNRKLLTAEGDIVPRRSGMFTRSAQSRANIMMSMRRLGM